ncbi:MAG: hypothetical protein KBF88_07460, partial [Polyangiaceae bacterium]|nr:hypothetical protein [Polyangiaceae bacterium]
MSFEQHCPSEEDFSKAVSAHGQASDSLTVFAHLETCSSCAKLFAEMKEIANVAKLVSWKAPSEEQVSRLAGRIVADATSSAGVLAKERSWNRPSARAVENVRQRVLVSGARVHKETKLARWVAAGLAAAVFALAGSRMTHWQSPVTQEIAADPSSTAKAKPANETPIVRVETTVQPVNEKVPEVIAPRETVRAPESRPRETVRSHEHAPVKR